MRRGIVRRPARRPTDYPGELRRGWGLSRQSSRPGGSKVYLRGRWLIVKAYFLPRPFHGVIFRHSH